MYDYENYGVFRFKEDSADNIDNRSIFLAFCQTLVFLVWLVLFGIFLERIDDQCDSPIDTYALVAFWVFVGCFGFKLLSVVIPMALVSKQKDRGAMIFGIALNVLVTLAVTGLWAVGIYYLANRLPAEGCRSLYYLTLAWVIMGTIDVTFLFVIPVVRLVGYLSSRGSVDKKEDSDLLLCGDVDKKEDSGLLEA